MSVIIVLIVIVGLIFLKFKSANIKGKMGEKKVSVTLSFLPKDEYVVLNDMMFKSGNRTTQIDHIVVSVHGIFVIETKNYKGWIIGKCNSEKWTQNIWGTKFSLYNPIFQNKSHIKFLINKFPVLRDNISIIYPIVVFLGASKVQLNGDCNCVMSRSQLNKYIKSCRQSVITIEDCHNIATILESENIVDKEERKQHKAFAQKAAYYRKSKIAEGVCPQCGGKLVLRNGQYGSFYGCSNYPRCHYILKE